MTAIDIDIVTSQRDALGECPLWDERSSAVLWIDSHQQLVKRHTPASGVYQEWKLPSAIGSMALCESGRLMLALANEFVYLDLATGQLESITTVTHIADRIRLNDGRTDRAGRFLVGSVVMGRRDKLGALYQLDGGARLRQVGAGLACANAICFSPGGEWFYHTDSHTRKIMRSAYDTATGVVGNAEVFVDTDPLGSGADGATVDRDGCLWTALVEVGKVACFAPDGQLARRAYQGGDVLGGMSFEEAVNTDPRRIDGLITQELAPLFGPAPSSISDFYVRAASDLRAVSGGRMTASALVEVITRNDAYAMRFAQLPKSLLRQMLPDIEQRLGRAAGIARRASMYATALEDRRSWMELHEYIAELPSRLRAALSARIPSRSSRLALE